MSPRSLFFGIVVCGLPFAVAIGWAAADPSAPPSATVRDGVRGAGGIGSAPTTYLSRSAEPVAGTWTRTPPQPVPVDTPEPTRPRSSASARPSVTDTTVPEPTLTVPPEATPTTTAPEPTATATEPPASETPELSPGLLERWDLRP